MDLKERMKLYTVNMELLKTIHLLTFMFQPTAVMKVETEASTAHMLLSQKPLKTV